jgi:hypothetical protein
MIGRSASACARSPRYPEPVNAVFVDRASRNCGTVPVIAAF